MSYKIKYIFLAIAIVSGLLAVYLIKRVYSKYGKINKTIIVSGKDSLLINSTNFDMEVIGSGHGHNDFKTGIATFTFDNEQDKTHVPELRYFLVSYTTKLKESTRIIYGNTWFCSNSFPYKRQIDSVVFHSLPYKRRCYEHVIITSIYEFKNISDYNNFDNKYDDFDNVSEHKKSCK